mgnify:CR=1 FL=1
MEEKIDPRSVDAMKSFAASLEEADNKFKSLERRMSKFNTDMDTIRARTSDFGQSMKEMTRVESFETSPQMNAAQASSATATPAPVAPASNPMARGPSDSVSKVEIGTIRIDVSGVTDKTDKEKLARDISNRVAKELKSKMGGPMSSGGYNRGV